MSTNLYNYSLKVLFFEQNSSSRAVMLNGTGSNKIVTYRDGRSFDYFLRGENTQTRGKHYHVSW